MNELIELINNTAVLDNLKTWIMTMSLWNLAGLTLIIFSIPGLSLEVKVNEVKNTSPKWVFMGVVLILMIMYPHNLLIACSPIFLLVWLLLTWQKPVFMYLNLFMPAGHKLKI